MEVTLGTIPDGWKHAPLGQLCGRITTGKLDANAMVADGDYPFFTCARESYRIDNYAFDCEALLVSGNGANVGYVHYYNGKFNAYQRTYVLSEFTADVHYLRLFLDRNLQGRIRVEVNAGNTPYITMGTLTEMGIVLPTASTEQRAIAEALSDVDGLLGGLDRLIAKKRDLKQAAMQQLLTGKTRLSGFGPTRSFKSYAYGLIPDDWNTLPFSKVSTMNGRIGWQGLKQEEFTDNPEHPYLITGMNFKDGKIRWDEVYHIPPKRYCEAPAIQLKRSDVLITKDGTIGKLLFVDEIPHPGLASLNSHLLVFRPVDGQFVPRFLFYQLGSPPFFQHIELHKSGTTFFGLTQAATGKYPVVLPTVPEQTAIAEVLSDMDAELAALEQRREKTRALKQGMMQELLTGRTRLV